MILYGIENPGVTGTLYLFRRSPELSHGVPKTQFRESVTPYPLHRFPELPLGARVPCHAWIALSLLDSAS